MTTLNDGSDREPLDAAEAATLHLIMGTVSGASDRHLHELWDAFLTLPETGYDQFINWYSLIASTGQTALSVHGVPPDAEGFLTFAQRQPDSGRFAVVAPDTVPAGIALAGRFAAAALRRDHAMASALWTAIDDQVRDQFFSTLIDVFKQLARQIRDVVTDTHQDGSR